MKDFFIEVSGKTLKAIWKRLQPFLKRLFPALALVLIACGDDSSTTTTTITTTINCYANRDVSVEAIEQAEAAGLTVTLDGETHQFCGDTTQIDAIISINEPEELAEVLATARFVEE